MPKIILIDKSQEITDAWLKVFSKEELQRYGIEIINADFRELPRNIGRNYLLTTAGNSYGVMGGGLDYIIAKCFPGLENRVRRWIDEKFFGEMPVGFSEAFYMLENYYPFSGVIYTPTMRAPTRIKNTENVYLATRATLRVLGKEPDLYLVMTGFGGGCGQVPPHQIAACMRLAIQLHYGGPRPTNTRGMWELDSLIKITSRK
jgi:O-acetyl-ADP-ribose deacetylase (regulator of RNase III)